MSLLPTLAPAKLLNKRSVNSKALEGEMGMLTFLTHLVTLVLWAISLLHVYWASGGRWAMGAVLPEFPSSSKPVFTPTPIMTLVVALALGMAGAVVQLERWSPSTFSVWSVYILAAVFSLRAMGDFRYAGLFKTARGTLFSRMDDQIYTPLCIVLAGSLWVLAFY
jgi:hypothetical protein